MNRALKIYKKLVSDGQIDDKTDSDLFTDFKDNEVREYLYKFEKELGFKLVELPHIVYLVPDIDNDILGFSLRDMRESIGSNARLVDTFLQCYIIMCILHMFFGGKNNNPKQADFIQVKDIVKNLDNRFSKTLTDEQTEIEENYSINFKNIAETWRLRPVFEDGKKVTRTELVLKACRLLKKHKLINIFDDDREIRTTRKLDDLMLNFYLNEKRISEINTIFSKAN